MDDVGAIIKTVLELVDTGGPKLVAAICCGAVYFLWRENAMLRADNAQLRVDLRAADKALSDRNAQEVDRLSRENERMRDYYVPALSALAEVRRSISGRTRSEEGRAQRRPGDKRHAEPE